MTALIHLQICVELRLKIDVYAFTHTMVDKYTDKTVSSYGVLMFPLI